MREIGLQDKGGSTQMLRHTDINKATFLDMILDSSCIDVKRVSNTSEDLLGYIMDHLIAQL